MGVGCTQIPLREFRMTNDLLDRRAAVLSLAAAAGAVGVSASCTAQGGRMGRPRFMDVSLNQWMALTPPELVHPI
jgi:hypothetical protein